VIAWALDATHGWSPEDIDRVIKSGAPAIPATTKL
jgi:hypothetical protein